MGTKARKSYRRKVVDYGETSTNGFWILILECKHAASRIRGAYDRVWPPKTLYCKGCVRDDEDIAHHKRELARLEGK
jgi:hypothetical protein